MLTKAELVFYFQMNANISFTALLCCIFFLHVKQKTFDLRANWPKWYKVPIPDYLVIKYQKHVI